MSNSTRIAAGTVGGLALLSGPVRWLLAGLHALGIFGDIDMALELAQNSNWTVNWDAVWTVVFFLSAGTFCAMQWPWFQKIQRRRRNARQRHWNRSVSWAICSYLPHLSVLGHGQKGRDAWVSAYEAFVSAAADGKIDIAGRRPGNGVIEKIRRRYFREGEIDRDSVAAENSGGGGRLVSKSEPHETLYEGLLIDGRQIEGVWPHRRDISEW